MRYRVEKSLLWENTEFPAAISFGLNHERLGYCKRYASLNTLNIQTCTNTPLVRKHRVSV